MLLQQPEDNTGVLIFPLLPKLAETMIFSQLEKTILSSCLLKSQTRIILQMVQLFFPPLNLSKVFNAGPNF